MEVSCSAFVVAHEVHVSTVVVKVALPLVSEHVIQVFIVALLLSIFVLFSIVESIIVFDLLESALDIVTFQHLAELLACLQAFNPLPRLLLLLVLALELVVPVLLLVDVQVHRLCDVLQLLRDLFLHGELLRRGAQRPA